MEGWLFYHGIHPRDVVRGQNGLICKFFSSYQEQQLIRNHLYLDHCKALCWLHSPAYFEGEYNLSVLNYNICMVT